MADQSWVEDRSIDILKTEPDITAKKLQKKLQEQYDVDIGYDTVFRGKERALAQLYGSWDDSFRRLFNFKAEMELRSPGSIVEVDTITKDGKVYFSRFFMSLKPCVEGFHAGCRPYLSIDSTALNGKWNGQLASCSALDGHNWMFPIAVAFFQSETEDNWAWFMSHLHRAIGHMPTLAISTDACKGLENAVKKVFPQAERRECFRHLMQNFVKKFQGDVFGHMWPEAKAYKETAFRYHMDKVLEADPSVGEYLDTYHSLLWMRCKFNTDIKCDYIHNNLSESFNNWIKDYKDLPVDELADTIREKIMRLMNKRRTIGELLQGKMLPAVIQQINNRSRGLGHLKTGKSSDTMAEVRDTSKKNLRHVVKLEEHGCTCLEWQHTGKPCEHALVFLMERRNLKLDNYLHEYFSLRQI